MKTINLYLAVFCFFASIYSLVCVFAYNQYEAFYACLICMLMGVAFYAFYLAGYWKEKYEKQVGYTNYVDTIDRMKRV